MPFYHASKNQNTTHPTRYELLVHRNNPAGRALVSLSVLSSNDRSEIEAEHARRDAQWGDASNSIRKHSRLEIVEHAKWYDQ